MTAPVTTPAPTADLLAPVDHLIVTFPRPRLTRAGFGELVELVDRGVVRVLDLEFVSKALDGTVARVDTAQAVADAEDDLSMVLGTYSGLLDDDDVAALGEMLEPGTLGGVLIYENTWALGMIGALARSGAVVVSHGPVSHDDLNAVLDEIG
jgi:hypothetical protein